MPATIRKYVVDAGVARSSGKGQSEDPLSNRCRFVLQRIQSIRRFHVLFNEKLIGEWDEHRSSFAADWFQLMTSRGRVKKAERRPSIADELDEETVNRIPDRTKKDLHLIDAALVANKRLFTNDTYIEVDFCQADAGTWRGLGIKIILISQREDCGEELGCNIP